LITFESARYVVVLIVFPVALLRRLDAADAYQVRRRGYISSHSNGCGFGNNGSRRGLCPDGSLLGLLRLLRLL